MKRKLSLAVLATLGAFALVLVSGVPLPYTANAQASPSVAVSLPQDYVVLGNTLTATMSYTDLKHDNDRSTIDYVFRADILGADECEDQANGYGLGVDRYIRLVDEDPEVRTGRISANCPEGDYVLEAVIANADGVTLNSASVQFQVLDIFPSVLTDFTHKSGLLQGTQGTLTMNFDSLRYDNDRSTVDYMFRADVLGADECEDQANGYGLGVDRYIRLVDGPVSELFPDLGHREIRTGKTSVNCPVGDYVIQTVIADADGNVLNWSYVDFHVRESFPPTIELGMKPGPKTPAGQGATVTMEFGNLWNPEADYVYRAKLMRRVGFDYANVESMPACEGTGMGEYLPVSAAAEDTEAVHTGTILLCGTDHYAVDVSLFDANTVESGCNQDNECEPLASERLRFNLVKVPPVIGLNLSIGDTMLLGGVAEVTMRFSSLDSETDYIYRADLFYGWADAPYGGLPANNCEGPGVGEHLSVSNAGSVEAVHTGTVTPCLRGHYYVEVKIFNTDHEELARATVEFEVVEPAPPLSSDATLSGLALSGVTLAFDPATTGYAADVDHGVTETTVTVTVNDDGASYTVKLDGVADSDGAVPLAEGSNDITVEVTAEDGETTRTYTVTVTRAGPPASTDAALSGLALSGVTLAFDPAVTGYTADVGNDVTETTVTATTSDDGASYVVKLDGIADSDGVVSLAEGSNVITVEVTAEDGETTKTYTVTVTRAEAAAPSEPVTVTLIPPSERDSTGTDITIEWADSGSCGGEYFVAAYSDEELWVVVRDLGFHPAPATTTLSADMGLSWDRISSYDWWVGVTCTSEWTLVGKASLQSGLPGGS